MNIGEFRHRIIISKLYLYQDEYDNEIEEWREIARPWAKVSNIYGKEYFAAASVHLEKMLIFTIRYKAGLDEEMQIRFQGKDYNIQFIDNIKYRNKYLEIKALLK